MKPRDHQEQRLLLGIILRRRGNHARGFGPGAFLWPILPFIFFNPSALAGEASPDGVRDNSSRTLQGVPSVVTRPHLPRFEFWSQAYEQWVKTNNAAGVDFLLARCCRALDGGRLVQPAIIGLSANKENRRAADLVVVFPTAGTPAQGGAVTLSEISLRFPLDNAGIMEQASATLPPGGKAESYLARIRYGYAQAKTTGAKSKHGERKTTFGLCVDLKGFNAQFAAAVADVRLQAAPTQEAFRNWAQQSPGYTPAFAISRLELNRRLEQGKFSTLPEPPEVPSDMQSDLQVTLKEEVSTGN